ncbi:unnamed protein product [Diamesa tonsa]
MVSNKNVDKSSYQSKHYRELSQAGVSKGLRLTCVIYQNKALCFANIKDLSTCYVARCEICYLFPAVAESIKNLKLAMTYKCPKALMPIARNYDNSASIWLGNTRNSRADINSKFEFERLTNTPHVVLHPSVIMKKGLLITTKDLRIGEIIAVEHPFFGASLKASAHMNCANCMKFLMFTLIPCDGSMFCNEECKQKAKEGFHKYECEVIDQISLTFKDFNKVLMVLRIFFKALAICGGSIAELEKLITENDDRNILDFDYNSAEFLSDPKQHVIAAFAFNNKLMPWGLKRRREESVIYDKFLRLFPKLKRIWKNGKGKPFALHFLITQARYAFTTETNHCYDSERWEGGVYPLRSYMKSSCMPNVMGHFYDRCCVVYKAQKPIKAGTVITTQHGPLFFDHLKIDRIKHYLECFLIVCKCVACTKRYYTFANKNIIDRVVKQAGRFQQCKSYAQAVHLINIEYQITRRKWKRSPNLNVMMLWACILKLNIDMSWHMNMSRYQDKD